MTSLLLTADNEIDDLDYIFEEIRSQAFDLSECINAIKKLHDCTAKGTKAQQYYFTMYSVLSAQQDLMQKMADYSILCVNNRARLEIVERLLLMVLNRDADLKGNKISEKILDALIERRNQSSNARNSASAMTGVSPQPQ